MSTTWRRTGRSSSRTTRKCYHCSMIHPELCRVSPPTSGRTSTTGTATGSAAGWSCARVRRRCRSTVAAAAWRWRGSTSTSRRRSCTSRSLPNLLISLHPDYVMTTSWCRSLPTRPGSRAGGPSRPTSRRARFQPGVRRGLLGPHQPPRLVGLRVRPARHACPPLRSGPLAPDEDGVYQFVTHLARAYQGRRGRL